MAQRASLLMGSFMRPTSRDARRTAHRRNGRVDGRCLSGVAPPELSPKMPPHDSVAIGVGSLSEGQHCGALRYSTHARLRGGVAEAPLRAAAPLVSSATLRRNASMRLTTRCGGAKVFLRSGTAPAC